MALTTGVGSEEVLFSPLQYFGKSPFSSLGRTSLISFTLDELQKSDKSLSKIESLLIKGHVYSIENYDAIVASVSSITNQYRPVYSTYQFISMDSLNWTNPSVIRGLDNLHSFDTVVLENDIVEHHKIFLNKFNESYKKYYNTDIKILKYIKGLFQK